MRIHTIIRRSDMRNSSNARKSSCHSKNNARNNAKTNNSQNSRNNTK